MALAVLVVIFVALRVRLSSYVTILVNLYLGIINLGGSCKCTTAPPCPAC
ncbi:hypothetical protein QPX96_06465 [Limosilactobacillus fermentum]|nr:hypothetical protein [Limosilactobacillus fermentum]